MNNPSLIESLTEDLKPVRGISFAMFLRLIGMLLLFLSACILLTLGMRVDFGEDIATIAKPGFFLLIAANALVVLYHSAMPGHAVKNFLRPLAIVCVTALLALAYKFAGDGMDVAKQGVGMPYGNFCFWCILLFGVVPLGFLIHWLRRCAPENSMVTGMFAGVVSGSLAAFAYGLHCATDNMYYISVWYVLPVLLHAVLGAVLGRTLLRW